MNTDLASSGRRCTLAVAFALALGACAGARPRPAAIREVQILAVNDFHGQLEGGGELDGRPAGGAPVLAAWLRAARAGKEDATLIAFAGDLVGASPAASALLQDEPTIAFANGLANDLCAPLPPERRDDQAALSFDPGCDVVATTGNHELDEGWPELVRLWRGGRHARGPFLEADWRGARFPLVAANVVARETGTPLLPPFVVRERAGVRIGVIGAVTRDAKHLVDPAGAEGLAFREEVEAVNEAARALAAQGVRTIVVLLHEGGDAPAYRGTTRALQPVPEPVASLASRLDAEVDVVISGHAHGFTNAIVGNSGGRPVLVTQAWSGGRGFARVVLEVEAATGDVVARRAEIVRALADEGPGLAPDPAAARIVDAARSALGERVGVVVATASAPIARGARSPAAGESYESALGDLVADALRAAAKADAALVNAGCLRADLPAGPITWGNLHAALPFENPVVTLELTGEQLLAALEAQWGDGREPRVLAVSGLRYAWDPSAPPGERVVRAWLGGAPLDATRTYAVAVPSFLASGGDGFAVLATAPRRGGAGPIDRDAVEAWLRALPQPLAPELDGRIERYGDEWRQRSP